MSQAQIWWVQDDESPKGIAIPHSRVRPWDEVVCK